MNESYVQHEENNFWKLGIISHQMNKACSCFEKVFGAQTAPKLPRAHAPLTTRHATRALLVHVRCALVNTTAICSLVAQMLTKRAKEKVHLLSGRSLLSMLYLLNNTLVMVVMAAVGQKVKTRTKSIHIKACRLNLQAVADNRRRKYTRDLLRMWSQQARGLRCFAGIPLAMPLLPAAFTISASYTIVTLQFTNLI
ncbi:hypothetical protein EVAR_82004_1 [Eumeta japonica]|uniref:Gustatory receptor n=1 Tax=Eumeta variegata TaxID=151549 RepID=A0A4C1VX92_EUMVA|nr:hypothetical protein EVAR_82004_1 [Eumeta japonica]